MGASAPEDHIPVAITNHVICDFAQGLAASASPALRALQKVLGQLHDDLAGPTEHNLYTLQYLAQARLPSAVEATAMET